MSKLTGAIISFIWARKNPVNFDIYCYAVAAGLIAGEGLGGVFNAMIEIAGGSPSIYGSAIGCPGDQFCG